VDSSRLYDRRVDPLVAYRERLQLIRQTLGPQRFIEGCPAGAPLNGIGFFNSYFNGEDVYNNWQGMYALFSSINANAFFNHLLVYVMPGEGMEVGPPMSVGEARRRRPKEVLETAESREEPLRGFGVTTAEARTLVSWVALSGVAYPLASVGAELPPERTRLLQQTLPPLPILPLDLYSRGNNMRWDLFKTVTPDTDIHHYAEILDLKVNAPAGVYDVAAFTNWRSAPETREINLRDKLGLAAGSPYIVFDFWAQKLVGVFSSGMKIEIDPHDTRVLAIHPALGHPQVVGTSRHISGAYSLPQIAWDPVRQALHGASQTVAGDDYSFFVYVPDGYSIGSIAAVDASGALAARQEADGPLLKVTVPARSASVQWTVAFTSQGEGAR